MTDATPLDAEQLEQFMRDGFTTLRAAFPREVALACRDVMWQKLEEQGICKDEPTTWVRRKGFDLCFSKHEAPWDGVITSRLTEALDQICGAGRWEEFPIGWWVVSFPGQLEGAPGVDGHWHVDGASHQHHLFSREVGAVLLMYFSDVVEDRGGGTAVAAGSHQNVVHRLADAGVRGLTPREATNAAIGEGVESMVTTSGQAGDVVIMHPFALHARTKNLAGKDAEGVRFLCHPCIALKQHMQLNRDDSTLYSPLELSIRRILDQRSEWDRRCLEPEACEQHRKRKENGAHEQTTEYKPEKPNAELVEMLGFGSFGKKRRHAGKQAVSSKRHALTA